MAYQKIEFFTNGKHKQSKLLVDGKEIKFTSLQIVGDKENDYDIILGLSMSKATKKQIESEKEPIGFNTNVIGDIVENEFELEEE